jgi:hypothetical protein
LLKGDCGQLVWVKSAVPLHMSANRTTANEKRSAEDVPGAHTPNR